MPQLIEVNEGNYVKALVAATILWESVVSEDPFYIRYLPSNKKWVVAGLSANNYGGRQLKMAGVLTADSAIEALQAFYDELFESFERPVREAKERLGVSEKRRETFQTTLVEALGGEDLMLVDSGVDIDTLSENIEGL
jgi:wobble nucleotide-excising tRNase